MNNITEVTNLKMNSTVSLQTPNNILYVDNTQQNQGFSADEFEIMIPKEINLKEVKRKFASSNHECANHEKFLIKCAEFLKLIYVRQALTYNREYRGYINLASNILKNRFGSSQCNQPLYYKYIIDSLISAGLVERDDSYFANKGQGKCKGYRVILGNPQEMELSDVGNEVTESLLKIEDYNYFSELKKMEMNEDQYLLIANLLHKPEKDQAFFVYNNWVMNRHYIRVDDYGRIHSLLTQMPKELRCCFTIDGEPIHEVDIHACQPFLLLIAAKEHLNYNKHTKKSFEELIGLNNELKEYVDRIQSGTFYEHLYRQHNNIKKVPVKKSEIDKYKINLFKSIFFSDITDDANTRKSYRIFTSVYPTVSDIINKIKKKEGYKSVAQRLQGYESEVMNDVISRLKDIDHSRFYLRFHDAILCKQQDCTLVADVLDAVMLEEVDVFGRPKEGTWGMSIEAVLGSLGLELYTLRKNIAFERYIGKEKNRAFRAIEKNAKISTEEKIKQEKSFIWYYGNNPANQQRLTQLENDFKSFQFIYPQNWTGSRIEAFKEYSRTVIENHFATITKEKDETFVYYADWNLNRLRDVLAA